MYYIYSVYIIYSIYSIYSVYSIYILGGGLALGGLRGALILWRCRRRQPRAIWSSQYDAARSALAGPDGVERGPRGADRTGEATGGRGEGRARQGRALAGGAGRTHHRGFACESRGLRRYSGVLWWSLVGYGCTLAYSRGLCLREPNLVCLLEAQPFKHLLLVLRIRL